jgi:hypothetical protein
MAITASSEDVLVPGKDVGCATQGSKLPKAGRDVGEQVRSSPFSTLLRPVLLQDKTKPGAVIRPGYPRTSEVCRFLLYSRYKHKKSQVVF